MNNDATREPHAARWLALPRLLGLRLTRPASFVLAWLAIIGFCAATWILATALLL